MSVIRKLFGGTNVKGEGDMDVQAGSLGLSVAETVRLYASGPGDMLASVRRMRGEDLVTAAKGCGLAPTILQRYESNQATPTMPELVAFSEHFKADLRVLMEAFGLVKEDATAESMGLAAKFDGDLSEEEKQELRELVAVAKAKKPR